MTIQRYASSPKPFDTSAQKTLSLSHFRIQFKLTFSSYSNIKAQRRPRTETERDYSIWLRAVSRTSTSNIDSHSTSPNPPNVTNLKDLSSKTAEEKFGVKKNGRIEFKLHLANGKNHQNQQCYFNYNFYGRSFHGNRFPFAIASYYTSSSRAAESCRILLPRRMKSKR